MIGAAAQSVSLSLVALERPRVASTGSAFAKPTSAPTRLNPVDELVLSIEAEDILASLPDISSIDEQQLAAEIAATKQSTAVAEPLSAPSADTSAVPQDDTEETSAVEAEQVSEEPAESSTQQLTSEEEDQVKKLADRDREVRAHEQAHVAAAGPYLRGGPTYTYQKGPDGKRYAIGGEVQIDTSPVPDDPEATIRKAQVVRAAALAPAEPSAQDRAVASAATKMQQQAQAELSRIQQQQTQPQAYSTIDLWA